MFSFIFFSFISFPFFILFYWFLLVFIVVRQALITPIGNLDMFQPLA
jgi:hypothetical protein